MVFHSRLLGGKGGESLAFPHPLRRLQQPQGPTEGPKRGKTHLCPGPRPGSQVSPHRMPTPPRPAFPARPPALGSRACGHSLGLPHSLAPPRCDLRKGGGGGGTERWLPTAASAPALSSNRFEPLSTLLALGTPPAPLPGTHASPGGQESPSHPAAVQTSLTPERPAGKVGVGLRTRLRRWKGVEAGAGERRGLWSSYSQEKHPWSMI